MVVGFLNVIFVFDLGLDFCSTMEPNITEGTLMSANFQDFGAQFRCECRITQPRSHPSSLVINSVINFEVEDNSYNQCNQRMVIKVNKLNFNVCPLDDYVQHTLSNIELGSGEHLYIYTLGTQDERWKVKYQFKGKLCSVSFLSVPFLNITIKLFHFVERKLLHVHIIRFGVLPIIYIYKWSALKFNEHQIYQIINYMNVTKNL